ncbi:hypothetical protein GMORB2_1624 [Geosmithia morbida]|uniref:Uncharacterized protein n=1 Tax=Geosmithia morbida TaxID=1094350 RepID=A0A9P4YS65_9HYPO|nr:uncharacterized protein GMORB2_1624 [Geosmithia morbida]KAF4121785.1 hypothetical protein GMORB2_1624 [Geosmithia morbida]
MATITSPTSPTSLTQQPSAPPPPPQRLDDTASPQLPQGRCRYILIAPELRGHRCSCVNFSRDRALPGAMCDCVSRVSQLEETVDKNRYDVQAELEGSYHHISAAWQLIEQLRQRMAAVEATHRIQSEQLARAGKELQDLRNRHLELLETDEMLEERIEKLEEVPPPDDAVTSPSPPIAAASASAAAAAAAAAATKPCLLDGRHRTLLLPSQQPLSAPPSLSSSPVDACNRDGHTSVVAGREGDGEAWTVHVSLMPSRERPFPYEKDTNAYKRCLSRGLHRMIAIQGTSGEAFAAAVSRTFGHILGDQAWEPLRAKTCDARRLEGQTMLRPLEADVVAAVSGDRPSPYSRAFLRDNCAICDAHGNLQALYLAPRHVSFSWPTIRNLPVSLDGLEASWGYDQYLDIDRGDADEKENAPPPSSFNRESLPPPSSCFSRSQPPQPQPPSAAKRAASEMHTGGAVMSYGDDDGRMAKSRRVMRGMIETL